MICGEVEEGTGRVCDFDIDRTGRCAYQHQTDGVGWGSAPPPAPKGSRRKEVDAMAGAVKIQTPTAPPDPSKVKWREDRVVPVVRDSRPEAATDDSVIPDDEKWVSSTLTIFREFLRSRGTSFTTAEDLWPLVVAGYVEKRTMGRVVQEALRRGWIEEVGAKRLKGTYLTKDGQAFKQNKLVSIYVSRIIA